jgi:hypothetical protein
MSLAAGACRGSGASQPEDAQPYGRPADTPLNRFLGTDSSGTRARFSKQRQRQQQLVAECMARHGFRYIPVDPPGAVGAVGALGAADPVGAPVLTRRQFVDRYGFGISTTAGPTEPAGSSGSTGPHGRTTSTTAIDDPNAALVSALSASARRAYDEALYGPGAGSPNAPGPTGCEGEAMAALASRTIDPVVARGEPEIARLYQQVAADPRVEAAEHVYAICMAKAGYHAVRQPQDALDLVNQRLRQVSEGGDASDPGLMAETRRFELRVARDDYRCGLPLERVRLVVQRDVEQDFIDANRDLLERYRAALATGS